MGALTQGDKQVLVGLTLYVLACFAMLALAWWDVAHVWEGKP